MFTAILIIQILCYTDSKLQKEPSFESRSVSETLFLNTTRLLQQARNLVSFIRSVTWGNISDLYRNQWITILKLSYPQNINRLILNICMKRRKKKKENKFFQEKSLPVTNFSVVKPFSLLQTNMEIWLGNTLSSCSIMNINVKKIQKMFFTQLS